MAGKSVWRSVGGLQVDDNGPVDPRKRQPPPSDQTDLNRGWRSSLEVIPRIIDMAGGQVASADVVVALADVAMWPHGALPRPLASFASYLSIFGIFPAYKYFLQVQVELGEL